MRKSLFKKAIALALVCAMTLPSALVASAATSDTAPSLNGNTPGAATSANQTEVSGNGSVDTATYNVILPSNLDFAVDQFAVSEKGQIYGVNYPIVNASPMAVKITVSVSNNSAPAKATLVDADDPALDSETDSNAAFLAAKIPTAVSVSANVSANAVAGDTISGNYIPDSDTIIAITSANATEFGFKLAKYATGSDLSANNCATFTWTGKVNSSHTWTNGDLQLKGTFKLTGLSPAVADQISADADNNLIGGGPEVTAATYDMTAGNDVIYRFAMPTGATGIASIGLTAYAGEIIPSSDYSYSNGILKIKGTSSKLASEWGPESGLQLTVSFTGSDETVALDLDIVQL